MAESCLIKKTHVRNKIREYGEVVFNNKTGNPVKIFDAEKEVIKAVEDYVSCRQEEIISAYPKGRMQTLFGL